MSKSMTPERAIEILNPEHREHYPSIEPVNEACRMGVEALKYRTPKKVAKIDDDWAKCPRCNSDMIYHRNPNFCDDCGQALDWSDN